MNNQEVVEEQYLYELIKDLYNGDTHYYTIVHKERMSRFAKGLEQIAEQTPKNIKEWEQLLQKLSKDELIFWTPMVGEKTAKNIHSSDTPLNNNTRRDICRIALKEMAEASAAYEDSFSINLKIDKYEFKGSMAILLLVVLGGLYEQINGSMRSEYGKHTEKIYFEYLCDALDITQGQNIDEPMFLIPYTLHFLQGSRWKNVKGEPIYCTSSREGVELDGLIFTISEDRTLRHLVGIEFTVGGRGNCSAQRNKIDHLEKFSYFLDDGLIYFAFDLGNQRTNIASCITPIFFKEQKGTAPLEIIYDKVVERIDAFPDLRKKIKLVDRESARKRFSELIMR